MSRIADMEAVAPPVSATEALRRNIVEIMYPGGSTDDLKEIMGGVVRDAKGGDHKARSLYLSHAMPFAREPQAGRSLSVQQAVMMPGSGTGQDLPNLTEWRWNIAHMLRDGGPLLDAQVRQATGGRLMYTDVLAVLNHEWFERDRETGRWGVTEKAFAEVPGLEPPSLPGPAAREQCREVPRHRPNGKAR